jgi:excisionase family DNA binding protein
MAATERCLIMAAAVSHILTVEEAAQVARCSVKTVRRAYTRGALTAYRRGGSRAVVLERNDVLAWVHGEMLGVQASTTPPAPARAAGERRRGGSNRATPEGRVPRLGDQVRFDLSTDALRARRAAASQPQEVS